jgi:glycosyltransferase involved in cell wall biosynthesis
MAMGKPVVAGRVGPGPEVLTDGVHGLLCDPHDPQAIADSILRLLQDPGLAERLAAAARERALSEFSIDHLVVKNEQFYHRCLEPHG